MANITTRMQQRRDTTANWAAENPVLLLGEFGYDTDVEKFKVGDGVTAWTVLDFLLEDELAAAQASADDAADSAAAAAATAASIPATTDPIVTDLIEDTGSDTRAALNATYVHAVTTGGFTRLYQDGVEL